MLITNQSELFGNSPKEGVYENKQRAVILSNSSSIANLQDDLRDAAISRVKASQKKQMRVIQASLQRAEKNNIRQAVRSLKEQRIEKNQNEKIQEKVEHAKMTYKERMANVLERRRKMSAEREKKRKESYQKEQ